MTDKLKLQRLDQDPRLPMIGSVDFERVLYVRLYELFRDIAGVTNRNGQAISDAISNVSTQLTEDINQAIEDISQAIEDIDQAVDGAMQKSANLGDVANTTAARSNLGLGNAATRNVGTTAGTVAEGNDARITGAAQKSANLSDLQNATTARNNLGLGSAATANIVGTMSSGAIIESGSNSNGQYIKFADGTQLCWFEYTSTTTVQIPAGSSFYTGNLLGSQAFPVEFLSGTRPATSISVHGPYAAWAASRLGPTSTQWGEFYHLSDNSRPSGSYTYVFYAVGRWQA